MKLLQHEDTHMLKIMNMFKASIIWIKVKYVLIMLIIYFKTRTHSEDAYFAEKP